MILAFELEYDKTNDKIALNESLLDLYNDGNLSLKDRVKIFEVLNNIEERAYQRAKSRAEHDIFLHKQSAGNAAVQYDTQLIIEYYQPYKIKLTKPRMLSEKSFPT
jgi:hypothetical protein